MSGKLALRLCTAALCLALALLTGSGVAAQGAALFESLPQNAVSNIAPAQADRVRALREVPSAAILELVRVNVGALQDETVSIPLPGAGAVVAQRRSLVTRSPSDFTWIGRVQVSDGDVILVVRNGDVTGEFRSGRDHYRLTPLGGGIHALIKVDQSKLPRLGPPLQVPQRGNISPQASQPTESRAPVRVDVLVAYTRNARIAYGGDMATLAQAWVDATNVYYTSSNANTVLRLAGTQQIAYNETPKTFGEVLSELAFGSDPEMAKVHARRDAIDADLVTLIVNHTELCGQAFLVAPASFAYSVVHYDCGSLVYAHELGHLFGADHDPAHAVQPTPYGPYAHGYINAARTWRTIMAYGDDCNFCPAIGHLSNPAIVYQGFPTGTAATHDNARVHRERVATVAAFRPFAAQCTISLNVTPVAGGTAGGNGTFNCGSSRTVTATANSGYGFVKWTENGTGVSTSAQYTFTLNANRSLVATFRESPHTIAVQASPKAGGAVSGGGTFAAGRSRTVKAVPASGYAFTRWIEDGVVVSTSAKYTFVLNADRNLVAKFKEAYSLAVSAAPKAGGSVSGGGVFPAGSTQSVVATPNSGFVFLNWSEGGAVVSTTKRYAFRLNANRALAANFKKTYTINVSVKPSAGGVVAGGGTFLAGSRRTVIATPTSGYAFVRWTEKGNPVGTAASYTFKLNADRNLVAKFVDNKSQFLVNTEIVGNQRGSKVVALSDGGFLVVWTSDAQDGSGTGIYGQRYDENGERVGAEFLVNTTTTGQQKEPSVAVLSDGGFVAVWTSIGQDGSGAGVYGQCFRVNGEPVGAEFLVNTTTAGEQMMPAVAGLANGGFVVVWVSENGPSFEVHGQRFSARRRRSGGEFRVGTYSDDYAQAPSVTGLDDGGFIVMVASDRGDGTQFNVYGQRYRPNGRPGGKQIRANAYVENFQWQQSVARLVDGGFVVVWVSLNQQGPQHIMGQRFTAVGKRVGKNFQVNEHTSSAQQQPSVASLDDGGFVVTWASDGEDGSLFGVFGRRYAASGAPVGEPFPINSTTADSQLEPSVTGLADGGFIVTWSSYEFNGGEYNVYGTQFDP